MILGVVNIVKTCACAPVKASSSWWGAVLAAVVLLVGGVWLYGAAESALLGLRDSTGAANRTVALAVAAVLVVAAVTGAVWLILGRRREVAQRPLVEQHDRAMRAAILEHRRRPAIDPSRPGLPPTERATAVRLDRAGER